MICGSYEEMNETTKFKIFTVVVALFFTGKNAGALVYATSKLPTDGMGKRISTLSSDVNLVCGKILRLCVPWNKSGGKNEP